jgi:hypothetical protein
MANTRFKTWKRATLGGTGGPIDWDAGNMRIILTNQAFDDLAEATRNALDFYDDLSASYEITGTNYTAGGQALAGVSIASDGADGYAVSATDPVWANATIANAHGAVILLQVGGTLGADDPIAIYLDFGGAVSSTAAAFTVDLPSPFYILP